MVLAGWCVGVVQFAMFNWLVKIQKRLNIHVIAYVYVFSGYYIRAGLHSMHIVDKRKVWIDVKHNAADARLWKEFELLSFE